MHSVRRRQPPIEPAIAPMSTPSDTVPARMPLSPGGAGGDSGGDEGTGAAGAAGTGAATSARSTVCTASAAMPETRAARKLPVASGEVKADHEIVCEAVKRNALALESAAAELKAELQRHEPR